VRRSYDNYFTPAHATQALMDRISLFGRILEPCSGDGDIARVCGSRLGTTVYTNDLHAKRPSQFHLDIRAAESWRVIQRETGPIDWVVSNPPFSYATAIVKRSHEHARCGVAMLLRLSFLEPTLKRGEWLAANPPSALIVLPRISFTGDGKTDSVTCAWIVWTQMDIPTIAIVPRPSPVAAASTPSLLADASLEMEDTA
jgi:hypothetical protein